MQMPEGVRSLLTLSSKREMQIVEGGKKPLLTPPKEGNADTQKY
jgi:hypothetical protein